jgi:hypothetical protein
MEVHLHGGRDLRILARGCSPRQPRCTPADIHGDTSASGHVHWVSPLSESEGADDEPAIANASPVVDDDVSVGLRLEVTAARGSRAHPFEPVLMQGGVPASSRAVRPSSPDVSVLHCCIDRLARGAVRALTDGGPVINDVGCRHDVCGRYSAEGGVMDFTLSAIAVWRAASRRLACARVRTLVVNRTTSAASYREQWRPSAAGSSAALSRNPTE